LQEAAMHGLLGHVLAALVQMPPWHVPAETWHMSFVVQEVLSAFWQLPVAPQAWQLGQLLLVQQTPFVQNSPDVHSSLVAQPAPGGFLPQVLPRQTLGATHWSFDVHVPLQAVVPLHANGAHWLVPPPPLQWPAPSQVIARVRIAPVAGHEGGAHIWPAGHFWQPPAPSHLPSLRQVDASLTPHLPLGSTLFAAMGEHVPAVALSVQETQGPSQVALQHTFCAEQTRPEAH
jgi:hypothetical protein